MAAAPPGDRLAVLGGPEPRPDLGCLAGAQSGGVDLGRLVLGQLEPANELAGLEGELLQGGLIRPPGFDREADGSALRLEATVGIEQVPLAALVEELLLVVLAVDLDERPGDLGQAGRGDRLVVETGAGAAIDVDLAAADQVPAGPFHPGGDPGRLGAVPDEAAVGPRTEGQAEGVDQQALAGPGLAGDHVEAGAEGQVEPVDQGQVRDGQLEQPAGSGRGVVDRRGVVGHQLGRSSTLWRSRSQNGIALFGSTNRIGRSRAATSTTSPTLSGMSS